jgi:hypothetical protein
MEHHTTTNQIMENTFLQVRQIPHEHNANTVLKLIHRRCNDIQRQITLANIRERSSLIFYYEMKWGEGKKNTQPVAQERKEAWLRMGSWRLRELR